MVLSVQTGETAQSLEAQAKLEASAKHVKLTPLSEQHLGELVGAMFGGVQNSQHLAAWLHGQTGGNPGHCIDLTRLLLAQGAIRYTVGTFTLPHELENSVAIARHGEAALASIAGLPAQARDVVYLLGVHAGPLSGEQLAHATGLSARELVLAIEQLVQRGVLVASDDSVSCASESLRSALVSSRPDGELRAAQLTLSRALTIGNDKSSLATRIASARHLLAAGDEHTLEGASLLAAIDDNHKIDLASSRPALPLLEHALAVFDARNMPEQECLGLLIPLAMAGLYGQLDLQERYLSRTMAALSSVIGLTITERLKRYLGAGLALIVGMFVGFVRFSFTKRTYNRHTYLQHFANFGAIPSSASAASACAWDVRETYRIAHMLDPFAAASKKSAMYLMMKFCLATADLIAVKIKASSESYAELYEVFRGKVLGLDAVTLEQFRAGAIHGKAQALVTDAAPEAVTLANQLEQRHTFYAPHAAGILMTYHLYRGEVHKALPYRERAEALALRGGSSWSSMVVLTMRMVQGYVNIGDVVSLVHVVADLARVAKLAPSIALLRTLAEAHLEVLRGHPERALPIYERELNNDAGRTLPSYPIERSVHIQALCLLGRFDEARTLALALIDEVAASGRDGDAIVITPRIRLANAEAGLGNLAQAATLIDACFERAGRYGNPLFLGGVHKERAHVAALAGDSATFYLHLNAMSECFTSTENPWLIQQCDALRALGVRLGVAQEVAQTSRPMEDLDGATAIETGEQQAHLTETSTTIEDAREKAETLQKVRSRVGSRRAAVRERQRASRGAGQSTPLCTQARAVRRRTRDHVRLGSCAA
ncbi:MAG: hypothetical protein RLZZ450_3110 [Pseudomonadota bacterium]|jgi:hypothetical protein